MLGRLGAQLTQDDRVVPADDQGDGAGGQHRGQGVGDLPGGALGVAGSGGDIPAVDDRERVEHVHLEHGMPAAHHQAHLAHGGRP